MTRPTRERPGFFRMEAAMPHFPIKYIVLWAENLI